MAWSLIMNEDLDVNLDKITRLEIIDENGRSYTKWGVTEVQFSVQDNERTLKIFLKTSAN